MAPWFEVEDQVMAEVKRAFNPEFLNRLDEIILFTSLNDEDLIKIIGLQVEHINQNLAIKQIRIRLNEDAAKYILEKTASDRSYGARPLRRALQKYIEDPLSDMVIQGSLPKPSNLEVYLGDAGIYCRQIDPEVPVESEEATVTVGAGDSGSDGSPAVREGTPLYMFS